MTKAIRRSEIVHVRITEDERARFSARCAPNNLPISEAIRRVMREAADLGPTFDGEVGRDIRQLTGRLGAIGVDIEQAVRAINVGKAPDAMRLQTTFVEFAELLWEVERFYRSLCAAGRERHPAPVKAP